MCNCTNTRITVYILETQRCIFENIYYNYKSNDVNDLEKIVRRLVGSTPSQQEASRKMRPI